MKHLAIQSIFIMAYDYYTYSSFWGPLFSAYDKYMTLMICWDFSVCLLHYTMRIKSQYVLSAQQLNKYMSAEI